MPLRIALCDDEPHALDLLRRHVAAWAAARGEAVDSHAFPGPEPFWFAYEDSAAFDIMVFDIQMPGQDGMSLARQVRARDERVQMLFVTGYADYMAMGYEVSAVHYLMKPVAEAALFDALDRAAARLARAEPSLLLASGGTAMRVAQRDILYIEAIPHGVDIHTAGGVHPCRRALADIAAQLEASAFVQCHRAFWVGLRHVRRVTRQDVLLDGGQAVPLSRRLYHAVSDAFIRYYKEAAPCETPSPG